MRNKLKSQLKKIFIVIYIFDAQLFIHQKTYFSLYENYLRPLAGVDVLAFYISVYKKIVFDPWQESVCYFFYISVYTEIIFDPGRSRCVSFCLASILFFNKNIVQLKIEVMIKASNKSFFLLRMAIIMVSIITIYTNAAVIMTTIFVAFLG